MKSQARRDPIMTGPGRPHGSRASKQKTILASEKQSSIAHLAPATATSSAGKPSAVIGASPGKLGTALAQQSLRAVLGYCNSPQMTAPEAYINFAPGMITTAGEVTDVSTARFLQKFVADFRTFIARVLTPANVGVLYLLPALLKLCA